ncbi:ABC transporter substrate-binding protein, partial [Myxococcota bacterium]
MLNVNQSRHPEDTVTYTEIQYLNIPGDIAQRIAAGNPPDVIMHHAPELPTFLEKNGPNSLLALNDFLTSPSEADILPNLYPELVADATIDGQIYGLPHSVICMNSWVYNKAVFAAHHLHPPTTLDEFRAVCQTLKAAGVNPIALFGLTYLLQDLAAAVMGIDAYASFMTGGAPDERLLGKAIDLFAEVMDNYVDLTLGGFSNSLPGLVSGQSAMYVSGDWAEGALEDLGWTPGVDFNIIFAPGTQGLFMYTLEVLSVLSGTSHLQGALNFIDSAASLEGQTGFNEYGKAVPARRDVDASQLGSQRRFMVEGMTQAKRRLSVSPSLIWEGAIGSFLSSTPHD